MTTARIDALVLHDLAWLFLGKDLRRQAEQTAMLSPVLFSRNPKHKENREMIQGKSLNRLESVTSGVDAGCWLASRQLNG